MKFSNRNRRTYSLAVFCALTSVFLILNGCGDDDDDGAVIPVRHSISGKVTLDNGSGLSSVTMTLTGASSDNVITDASGNYTFTGLDNGSYTITPSRTGFTFSPTDNTQTVSGANKTGVNFTATSVQAATHSISGQVTSNGSGLSDVTMTLTGTSSDNVITDASGNYAFTGLDNGSYTITPSRTGFTFSPTDNTQTVSGGDIPGVNFTTTAGSSALIVVPCPLSGTTDVTIQDNVFTPDNVEISANGIVKWTNNGTTHTVTSGTTPTPDGKFDSDNLGTGATFCVQFFGTGTAQYFCKIHQDMTGSVTVTGGDSGAGDWDY
jgi:plastocyanin